MTSKHWKEDRKQRTEIIKKIGLGEIIKTAIVDKHHPNGPEVHQISNTGIVIISNQRTGKMITQLIARPGQIKRYFTEEEPAPAYLINLAREHQRMAYNFA